MSRFFPPRRRFSPPCVVGRVPCAQTSDRGKKIEMARSRDTPDPRRERFNTKIASRVDLNIANGEKRPGFDTRRRHLCVSAEGIALLPGVNKSRGFDSIFSFFVFSFFRFFERRDFSKGIICVGR